MEGSEGLRFDSRTLPEVALELPLPGTAEETDDDLLLAEAGSEESWVDWVAVGKPPRPGETAAVLADVDWEAEREDGDATGSGGVAKAEAWLRKFGLELGLVSDPLLEEALERDAASLDAAWAERVSEDDCLASAGVAEER